MIRGELRGGSPPRSIASVEVRMNEHDSGGATRGIAPSFDRFGRSPDERAWSDAGIAPPGDAPRLRKDARSRARRRGPRSNPDVRAVRAAPALEFPPRVTTRTPQEG